MCLCLAAASLQMKLVEAQFAVLPPLSTGQQTPSGVEPVVVAVLEAVVGAVCDAVAEQGLTDGSTSQAVTVAYIAAAKASTTSTPVVTFTVPFESLQALPKSCGTGAGRDMAFTQSSMSIDDSTGGDCGCGAGDDAGAMPESSGIPAVA